MRRILKTLMVIALLSLFQNPCIASVIVEGIIENSNEEYVMLAYTPRMRGNLNHDGFRSIGSSIDKDGSFRLECSGVADGGNYRLFFPDYMVPLVLFDNDSIHLEINLTESGEQKSYFATGQGAGKINVLDLDQFQYDYFDLEVERTLEEHGLYLDSIIGFQLKLLEKIYLGQTKDPIVSSTKNQNKIEKIVQSSPLSDKEYRFLMNIVNFQRYSLMSFYIAQQAQTKTDSHVIDLGRPIFKDFNQNHYNQASNINDFRLYNSLESILQVEYLKEMQFDNESRITFGNWNKHFSDKKYQDWCANFIRNSFSTDIYNKYYSEYASGLLTWGFKDDAVKDYLIRLDFDDENKYTKRIKGFRHLLKEGLDDEEFKLNRDSKNLDSKKFTNLVGTSENSLLHVVFWSAQAAGASIIDELPSLTDFENKYKDKIRTVYICIDKQDNKNLWAARIIDESWKAEHYFMPIETNKTTLQGIADKDISSLCSGGVNCILFRNYEVILKDLRGPFYMDNDTLRELLE